MARSQHQGKKIGTTDSEHLILPLLILCLNEISMFPVCWQTRTWCAESSSGQLLGQPRCDPADGMQQWEPTDLDFVPLPALTHWVISVPVNYILLLQLHFAEWHLVTFAHISSSMLKSTDAKLCKNMKYYWTKLQLLWRSVQGKRQQDVPMKTNWMCTARPKPSISNRVVPGVHVYEQSWSGMVLWIGTQILKPVESKIRDPVNLSFTRKVNIEYTATKLGSECEFKMQIHIQSRTNKPILVNTKQLLTHFVRLTPA